MSQFSPFDPPDLPAVVERLGSVLAGFGPAGATGGELFDAMVDDGYTGDRLGVVCALDWMLTRAQAAVSAYPYGRYWAAQFAPSMDAAEANL